MSILGIHLYWCASWRCCERLHLSSVHFFLKILSMHLPISWWVIYKHTCPHCTEWSAVFDQKWHDLHALPYHSPDLTPSDFFVSPDEKKSSKGNVLPIWKKMKQNNSRSTKRHQNQQVQKLFWTVEKNDSKGVLHHMGSTLKVTEVKHVRIST